MKILFLFTVNKSFLSDYFVSLANHVAALGHETLVYSLKQQAGYKVIKEVQYVTEHKKGLFQQYIAIYKLLKTEKPTVVISNFSYVNPALLAGQLLGIKKNIAWQHTLIEQTRATKRQIAIKSKFLRWADGVVVNSSRLKAELESAFKLQKKRIDIIPFWSSIDQYTPKKISLPTADFTIGCCGRLEIDKNQRSLLLAFATLKRSMPEANIKLVLAGDGKDKKYLEESAANLHIADSVVFLGLLSAEEMVYFYNKVNLVVLPSLHEAFGLTFIEALALNRPVLVSEAFGALSFIAPALLKEYNMVFKPDDVATLANMLVASIREEPQGHQKYRALYESCFSSEIILKKFEEIIDLHQPAINAV